MMLAVGAVAAALLCDPGGARAQPVDCDAERCDVQATIDAACPCDTATNHGEHVRCVRAQAKSLVSKQCRGKVVRCAAKSTCGKEGAVACERTGRNGRTKCKISRTAERCEARGGTILAAPNCCEPCATSTTTTVVVTTSSSSTTSTTLYGSPSRAFVGRILGLVD
jgi:hypothetical protein